MVSRDTEDASDNEEYEELDTESSKATLEAQKVICDEFHRAVAETFTLDAIVTLTLKINKGAESDIGISVMQHGHFEPEALKCLASHFVEAIEMEIEKRS